ncbi:MAG: hypothetical protein HFJ52_01665 [Clostridia bacterium]|nr:hypothetical protein [Clostridia bacterium]
MELSEGEKFALRNQAKAELERIEKVFNDENTKILIDNFKNTFLLCEATYKVILAEHQKCKGKTVTRLLVSMKQAPYALNFAGYDFEKDLLRKLFSAENHVGKKSVKKIRDSLTHKLDHDTINELLVRKEELFGYMNEFLVKIRTFDQNRVA